jgi:tetratricopeptide (TPR) repeat protein
VLASSSLACVAAAPPVSAAEHALTEGRIDDAVHTLQQQIAANPKDGQGYLLLCRAFYAERQFDDAIHACETANQLLPNNSVAQDWLGRAYGIKADDGGIITGMQLAHKVHDAFEAAVNLNPHNEDAIDDLSEYYVSAPSVVGGGTDKADALADKITPEFPRLAHKIHARAAEKRKDWGTAEREFRAAIAAKEIPYTWIDLGAYFKRRHQASNALEALQHAISLDTAKGPSLVDASATLIDLRIAPDLAIKSLQQYLGGNGRSAEAPAVRAHVLLAKVYEQKGDKDSARIELNKALGLAANYEPAKRALQKL